MPTPPPVSDMYARVQHVQTHHESEVMALEQVKQGWSVEVWSDGLGRHFAVQKWND